MVTALYYASQCGHYGIAKYMLEIGAKQIKCRTYQRYPIHQAAMNGHMQIVSLLIEHEADVNARDMHGLTPLYFSLYLQRGASLL